MTLIFSATLAAAREVYVRKKTLPEFFMPADAMKQPQQQFPIPQYTGGEAKTIKAIKGENPNQYKPLVAALPTPTRPVDTNNEAVIAPPTPAKKAQVAKAVKKSKNTQQSETPEYQLKYQEYLDSLGAVADGGKMPRDEQLEKDLKAMNSNKRQLIDSHIAADRALNEQRDLEKLQSQFLDIE